ncbi:methyltransferase domain-containing protein [Salinispira pacifica]|uniref:Gamma-tocopherol methyltransferase, delta-tocopherol methyltransferase n=1 Tax=Salinispira pacifica TaxID=1307761 RepID=V5WM97_9SPIO|nr:methyltransferase domain-containing protein [Salinispira pacifica]AHC16773.1 gamma-tocopherol methyltransferase, delta-tocopherol methyltransferase [Salinispira pacifica]
MNAEERRQISLPDSHSPAFTDTVAEYYNFNTPRFLAGKKRRIQGSIHRKLFPPGIRSTTLAENFSNRLILDDLVSAQPRRVLDLGCGIGGSIRYLQVHYPAEYTGITLSPVQSRMARELGTDVQTADFLDESWYDSRSPFDYMYAIESIQHNPDHGKLAENLASYSAPGSTLAIIDDFLVGSRTSHGSEHEHGSNGDHVSDNGNDELIRQFTKHWYAGGFTYLEDYISLMKHAGFICVEIQDLSSYMKAHRARTAAAAALVALLRLRKTQTPWTDNLIGGTALKRLQNRGVSGYFFLRFRKQEQEQHQ